jgi:HEPN domain-containing protein
MAPVDEAGSLLALALEDAAAFRVLISSGSVRPATALFHAQQAVEKAIKAVLVLHCVSFGRTHDLVELGYQAREVVPGSPFAIERLARLNPYAVAFRYGEPSADLIEPEEAEEIVASVTGWADACIQRVADHADGPRGSRPGDCRTYSRAAAE